MTILEVFTNFEFIFGLNFKNFLAHPKKKIQIFEHFVDIVGYPFSGAEKWHSGKWHFGINF